ncbi:MAG TPA: hypothetical protein VFV87_10685, partial [Pirellulaceae bacterium]|nr:hypothetical protein [Pirellulaceae bacterium]
TSAGLPTSLAPGTPLRQALDDHAAWIAIDALRPDQPGSPDSLDEAAQKLAAALCDDRVLAIYVTTPRRGSPRLMSANAGIREQLAAGQLLGKTGSTEGSEVYLDESSDKDEDAMPWSERRHKLRTLADDARVENAAGYAAVRVRFERGHVREDLWLNVVRSRRTDYRSEEFVGQLTTDSQLWPHLRAGERLRLSFYEPLEIKPLDTP